MSSVLGAPALLAYLHREPGGDIVADAIANGARISAANLTETLSKLADAGRAPAGVVEELHGRGILDGLLVVEPLTAEDALLGSRRHAGTRRRITRRGR